MIRDVPIDITLNIETRLDDAVTALGCRLDDVRHGEFWFAEARHASVAAPTPLLDNRVVIRMRTGTSDDLTVTIYPPTGDRLAGEWATSFDRDQCEYRISDQWCGDDHRLTASARTCHPSGSMSAAINAGTDPTHLLDATQRRFLVACASTGTPIDHLVIRGPITSLVWDTSLRTVRDVRVARWTSEHLDVVGVTTRINVLPGESAHHVAARAVGLASDLREGLRELGCQTSGLTSKTALALRALASAGA
ncbi:hypothetical protein [Gordonia aichiensis]|uniref:CYTH domain-containing protein n=1 Tax=Gordonia aichiensis NBRC 108223 TaxID=1220583 RepID=L7KI05_9ACTN|nr:hypothetical protein [Gordonia aichiensis]GAC48485.1 hypothetical protein GOACH_05_03560 [Gordonia aichiensis NBRC 108223]